MKKYVIRALILFVTVTLFSLSCVASDYTKVYIDGKEVEFTDETGYPFIDNGRTLVPLRVTMESFGASVEWVASEKCAVVKYGTTTVRCNIGRSSIYRNNIECANDASAVIVDSRTYLPIRAVLEAFGATVGWDGAVKIQSDESKAFVCSVIDTPSVTTNYWGIWFDAINEKQNGNYQIAAEKIISIANVFLSDNQSNSNAMLFKHLGECYSNMGDYAKASACFAKEAEYWSMADGMEQSYIDADRRSKLIKTDVQLYVKNYDKDFGASKNFGEMYEPESGVCLGAYVEGDSNLYNPYQPEKFYMDTYPVFAGRDMTSYILYISYGSDVSLYETHIQKAIEKDKLLQISLQPHQGLGVVNDKDGYLIRIAQYMENTGCKMMLRFACEMNEPTSLWYVSDPEVYKEKFRIVADIFHKYAPSVPVIWSVNYYPDNNYEDYYPGDEYVDYVGVSSYKEHTPVTDPLGQGVDRSRWSNQLDKLYSIYGHRKPIIISEGNASYTDYNTGADMTDFACRQIEDFYTYLPIKYPNIKYFFAFAVNDPPRSFSFSTNTKFFEAYQKGISNKEVYLSEFGKDEFVYDYYELGNNVPVKAEKTELCSYITTPLNDVSYVVYTVDGKELGVSYGIPYVAEVDFSDYAGKKVEITVMAFDASHRLIVSETSVVNVIE